MARSCSLLKNKPHHLLCLGPHYDMALKLQQKLAPHFTYCAIFTKIEPKKTYSLDNFELMLEVIYLAPEGVILGGGLNEEEGEEMRQLVAARKDENGQPMKFAKVLPGRFEQSRPEGLVETTQGLVGRGLQR
ncbi:uncharacterized protein Z519_01266 [Cladophialophora bantiana CBS 173.52]|uniref:Uncharacterized protein n=1 Tax=Cladophialophora bantiana (strain ATCC 10958 / CBS 173.52 / CDC B-1940 / NIH 8579) TaxID=1442370 RepID=A0A0D2GH51_CLAB1|nr:uncharacterized protein Z519_01266 [Cladophialophora bantiana CBS 173.52]KIW97682.1 hypothetical protein Z519_01266 [Cladophialophora bantiana CBS 173.52]